MATKLEIVEANFVHAAMLAPRVPDYARKGLAASSGRSPAEVLLSGITHSTQVYAMMVGGDVLAIYGVVPIPSIAGELGNIWGLNSDIIERNRKNFVKGTQIVVSRFLESYRILVQYIFAEHEGLLAMIKRYGGIVGDPEPYGRAGLPFKKIVITRENFHV